MVCKNMIDNQVDIKENELLHHYPNLLEILLIDRTSGKNIIWATDNYSHKGYKETDPITLQSVTGRNGGVIKPRVEKSKKEQQTRVREKAEVFTPSWVCNAQNNLVDEAWFGYPNVFNIENEDKTWTTTTEKIQFPEGKTWQDYIRSTRLEITCGEAPYLVSRYDTVTGAFIQPQDRIGLLDRKLRVINENVDTETDWLYWTLIAYQNIYGFDWQGDNVLLARENLLYSFIKYYTTRFGELTNHEILLEIANIISWNIWQMDGLKFVIPNSCHQEEAEKIQSFLFDVPVTQRAVKECDGCQKNNPYRHNGIYCYIKDWETHKKVRFVDLQKGRK